MKLLELESHTIMLAIKVIKIVITFFLIYISPSKCQITPLGGNQPRLRTIAVGYVLALTMAIFKDRHVCKLYSVIIADMLAF